MRRKRNLFQSVWDLPYGRTTQYHLFDAAKNSKEFVQKLQLQSKISIHEGCVNSICWNDDGKYLLSGSDDQKLAVVQAYDYTVRAYVHTAHKANIFSAKFLPNTGDNNVISCSGDGIIIYSDLDKPQTSLCNKFSCHKGTAYEIITVPHDSHTFLSCGEDRTVRWFDVRTKISCNKTDCKDDVLIHCTFPVTTLAVNPLTPYQLAIGCADSTVRIFDRRMLCTHSSVDISSECENPALMACFTVPDFAHRRRITSLCYSADGKEILVSYSSDYIYLFDVQDDLGKLPKVLSRDKCSNTGFSESEAGLLYGGRPLMKRLRIRGDWSDTGPNARPESEAREDTEPSNRSRRSVVRTMTDILARIFNNTNTTNNLRRSSSASSHVSSQSEAVDESEEDAGEQQSSENRPSPPRSTKDVSSKRKVPLDSGTLPAAKSGKTDPSQPSTSHAHNDAPDNVPVRDQEGSVDMEFNQVTEELMTRRQDLVDRHHSEPMVNLHYSGQSVSSGEITMDVTNSSEANERQWLEQSVSNLPDLQPQRERTPEAGPSTNYNERNEDSDLNSVPRTNSVSENDEADDDEDDVELVMEVDSWDTDDDTRHSRTRRETLSPGSLYNFVDSIQTVSKPLEKIEESHPVMLPRVKQKYTGHRNARTMIKEATFWGDNFVMSGSDCGHIFIWDRHTAENVMLLEADHHVVNCLQPHPFDPVLASSGIDYDIKLWAPLREEPFFNREKASEIIKRNEVMLEETKDTITVPASFMFRMFTTLSHFRTGRALRWGRMAREMRAANSDSSNR